MHHHQGMDAAAALIAPAEGVVRLEVVGVFPNELDDIVPSEQVKREVVLAVHEAERFGVPPSLVRAGVVHPTNVSTVGAGSAVEAGFGVTAEHDVRLLCKDALVQPQVFQHLPDVPFIWRFLEGPLCGREVLRFLHDFLLGALQVGQQILAVSLRPKRYGLLGGEGRCDGP